MDLITNLKIDLMLSESFRNELGPNIKGKCYENIYNIIGAHLEENRVYRDLEVAYGYTGIPTECMVRHCFLVLNRNKVIDPTLSWEKDNKIEYHIFKLLNVKEYVQLLSKFYETNATDNSPIMAGIIPEEKDYCDYLINHEIKIDTNSYNDFMKQYDEYGRVHTI